MADQFNPWEFFEQKGTSFPQNWSSPDMSWVKDFVNDVMQQAMPNQFGQGQTNERSERPQQKKSNTTSEVFETHHFIITRIKVPEDIFPESLKVMFLTNELQVEGVESQPICIKLPSNGLYKGSKAHFKDHVLEIRIPKRSRDKFQEIPIQS